MERMGHTVMVDIEENIIRVCKSLGLEPDLQMLKIKLMGVNVKDLIASKDLESYIKSCKLDKYDDIMLRSHIETLKSSKQKAVVKAKYGVETDGLRKSFKATSDILGIEYDEVIALHKTAIANLQEACKEYIANKENAMGL